MNVKGFIIEDDQGREVVLTCERLLGRSGSAFIIRGWQRRRLVPLQHTERELRQIVGQVWATLDELFRSLPRVVDKTDDDGERHAGAEIPCVKKVRGLRKVHSGACEDSREEWP